MHLTNHDLDNCRRRLAEYAATRREPGFDQKKLHAMVNGCAHRQGLLRADLPPAEERKLRKLFGKERLDLWT
jgi:hypothetical protein